MSLLHFLRKCVTDTPAAMRSARVVARNCYGQLYWSLKPGAPLAYHLPTGGTLLLDHNHAFTGVFWPDVEHYEPDVRAFLQQTLRPGDTFIDCGANVGYYSVQAGALVGSKGQVISIEANPRTFQLLERNLRVNHFGIPVHCALTSQIGEVELFMPRDWDVYSSLKADGLVEGDPDHSFKVTAQTLDEVVGTFSLKRVDVVKIDVEGGELDVIRSAPGLLSDFRPLIITEYGIKTWGSFGATHQDLKELAQQLEYALRLFDPTSRRLVPINDEVWQSGHVNIIMMPTGVQGEFRIGEPVAGVLMLAKRIARKLRITLLPPPGKLESRLIGELRETIRQLDPLPEDDSRTTAESIWRQHRIAVREKILHDDPRRFLNWEIIRNTMFFCDAARISPAFESLRQSKNWHSRWREATRESPVGLPLKFSHYPESSVNLIHQAYHLSQFEQRSGQLIEQFKVIVEFGGGYGSTCRLAHRLGFRGHYFIFDLPEFSALQRFYLRLNGINIATGKPLPAEPGLSCLSILEDLIAALKDQTIDLFIANWSLSEAPLGLRARVLPLVSRARNYLIGYQDQFGEVDNQRFFADWTASQPDVHWTNLPIEHLPTNNYLIGTRSFE